MSPKPKSKSLVLALISNWNSKNPWFEKSKEYKQFEELVFKATSILEKKLLVNYLKRALKRFLFRYSIKDNSLKMSSQFRDYFDRIRRGNARTASKKKRTVVTIPIMKILFSERPQQARSRRLGAGGLRQPEMLLWYYPPFFFYYLYEKILKPDIEHYLKDIYQEYVQKEVDPVVTTILEELVNRMKIEYGKPLKGKLFNLVLHKGQDSTKSGHAQQQEVLRYVENRGDAALHPPVFSSSTHQIKTNRNKKAYESLINGLIKLYYTNKITEVIQKKIALSIILFHALIMKYEPSIISALAEIIRIIEALEVVKKGGQNLENSLKMGESFGKYVLEIFIKVEQLKKKINPDDEILKLLDDWNEMEALPETNNADRMKMWEDKEKTMQKAAEEAAAAYAQEKTTQSAAAQSAVPELKLPGSMMTMIEGTASERNDDFADLSEGDDDGGGGDAGDDDGGGGDAGEHDDDGGDAGEHDDDGGGSGEDDDDGGDAGDSSKKKGGSFKKAKTLDVTHLEIDGNKQIQTKKHKRKKHKTKKHKTKKHKTKKIKQKK